MLVLLSPAKSLDFDSSPLKAHSQPSALDQSSLLIERMKDFSAPDLSRLMKVSAAIAELNHDRYRRFERPFTLNNAKQALVAFKGDTYRDMGLEQYAPADFDFAQRHIRILSGLYGVLRPLDLIQPYRLEMGTPLKTDRGGTLYAFWGSQITDCLGEALDAQGDRILINAASDEYFKAVEPESLGARIVKPVFEDYKNGVYKVISFYAKRARGLMASFLVRGRLHAVEQLYDFEAAGYQYAPEPSTPDRPVYRRRRD